MDAEKRVNPGLRATCPSGARCTTSNVQTPGTAQAVPSGWAVMDASVQKITLVIRNLRRKNEGKMKERMGPLPRSDSVWGIADRGCLALRAWAPPATVIGPLRGQERAPPGHATAASSGLTDA